MVSLHWGKGGLITGYKEGRYWEKASYGYLGGADRADQVSVFVSRAIGVDIERLNAAKKAQSTDSSVLSMTRHCPH